MLRGCFACGLFFTILFIVPGLGRLFENITYQIASLVPKDFIPPDVYIPGVLTPPFLLLIVAGFTIFGYRKGSKPPKVESVEDTRSAKEKLVEFFFFLAVCLAVFFFSFRSDYPGHSSIEIVSHPVFIILTILAALGVSYLVFSRHQSLQLLFFVIYSAIAAAFVLFLLGLTAYTLFECLTYALNH